MQRFKGIIFDMDGLLLDSEKLALAAFQETCTQYSLGDLSHVFKQCIGTNMTFSNAILAKALEGVMDHEKFRRRWDSVYKTLSDGKTISLKEGVEDLLKHIQSLAIPMAVATSTVTDKARSKLNLAEILSYFETVIGGDQVTNSKPDPEVYLKTALWLAVDPLECLALEDSPNGVKSALAAGMTVIQIPDLIQPTDELLSMGHIVLSSLLDVPEYRFH